MSTERAYSTSAPSDLGGERINRSSYGTKAVWFFRALLLVPLVVTANQPAQRWLGRHWKAVQRLTYVVWVTILIHLFLLFGLSAIFLEAVAVSMPLVILRLPWVRHWWTAVRRRGSRRVLRAVAAIALVGIFGLGFVPLANELAVRGSAAFVQKPNHD